MKQTVALWFVGTVLFAADVTGKWSGAVTPGNNADSVPLSLELRQKGTRVIGVAITQESGVCELLNGAIAGGRITFDIAVENESVHFDLAAAGDKLQGQATGKRDNGTQDGPVALTLERETPATAGPFSGTWIGTAEGTENGQKKIEAFILTLHRSGPAVTGTITDAFDVDHPLSNVKIVGSRIAFQVDKLQASLNVAGDKLTGTGSVDSGGAEQVLLLNLVRQPETSAKPSGVAGNWAGMGEIGANGQRFPISFRLHQKDNTVTGKCFDAKGTGVEITAAAMRGNQLEFDVGASTNRVHFKLTLSGDELNGDAVQLAQEHYSMKISAVRRLN